MSARLSDSEECGSCAHRNEIGGFKGFILCENPESNHCGHVLAVWHRACGGYETIELVETRDQKSEVGGQ